MRKIFSTSEYKRRNKKRSSDAIKNRQRRKNKSVSFVSSLKSTTEKHSSYFNSSPPATIPMQAPDDFSLINNAEDTLRYFSEVHEQLKSNKRVLFDVSKIKTLTTDAIAVLIAKIKDGKFNCNSGTMGNEPLDENLKKLFTQSGFYDYVKVRGGKPESQKNLMIHKVTKNRVEPDIAKEACLIGLRHTFNNEEIFEPLYDILIEIMQNTNNHAGSVRGKYDWWLNVYKDPETNRTSYTFLDLGVGIFNSLPVKSYKRDFLELLGLRSNLDLVPKLFAGEIKSRTARPERGKGIPQVFECSQHSTFEKFILIANDVFADLKNYDYKLLKNQFDGTMFYWEIIN